MVSNLITPRPLGCAVPLTENQTGFWNATLSKPSRLSRARLCADSTRVSGLLDIARLQRSIGFVARRHEALRTRVGIVNDSPAQIIAPPSEIEMPLIDISRVPSKVRDAEARQYGKGFMLREVDLCAGPLFDMRLLKLSEAEHVLILGTDHIISDAASCALLSREVWAVYRQLLHAEEPTLPPLAIQFPDLAVWQRDTRDCWLRHHLPYWQRKLPKADLICIPTDFETSEGNDAAAEIVHFPMGKSLTGDLRKVARETQCLLPLLFLSLYSAIITQWCKREEVFVAMPSHGRHGRPELHGVVGLLAHPVYLRLQVNDSDSALDLMHRTTEEYFSACSHEAFRLPPPIDAQRPTEIWFNWMPADSTAARRPSTKACLGGLLTQPFPLPIVWPKKFYPFFYDTPSGVVITVIYRRDLFKRLTIERFGNHFLSLARQVIQCPSTPLRPLATFV